MEQDQDKLEETHQLHESKKENLDKVIESKKSEESALQAKRKELESQLDARDVRSYNRLRDGLTNGIAVVAMEKGAALGMARPPQTQVEVRRKNKSINNENSGRIVVDLPFFKEDKEQLKV